MKNKNIGHVNYSLYSCKSPTGNSMLYFFFLFFTFSSLLSTGSEKNLLWTMCGVFLSWRITAIVHLRETKTKNIRERKQIFRQFVARITTSYIVSSKSYRTLFVVLGTSITTILSSNIYSHSSSIFTSFSCTYFNHPI